MQRPNILYIHSHDTGRYVAPYGYAVSTPHYQRLAEEGVLFRQAFCAAPSCSPSRASLLTGQSAHSSGMQGLAHRGWSLNDYNQHIVHTLRTVGYTSTLIGVQHVATDASIIGYDQVVPLEHTTAEFVAPAAVDFLQHAPAEPFFAAVGFSETHRIFPEPDTDDDARWQRPPAPLPDTPATREDMAAFHASARRLDAGVGAVLDALDQTGLAERTLVICTTDHGLAFPRMKCTLTDSGTGVLLILRGPGGWEGGRVSDALVSHIDLFPTLCDMLEIPRPAWLQGTSLLPLLHDDAAQVNEAVFAGVTYHAAYEPQRSVRTQRWKYIRRFDGRDRPVLPNCDDGPSKDEWLRAGWADRPVAAEYLYDLVFDPHEMENRIADPSVAPILSEMRERLDRWMHDTNDPLLNGRAPAPPGAVVNDPDGISPNEPVISAEP